MNTFDQSNKIGIIFTYLLSFLRNYRRSLSLALLFLVCQCNANSAPNCVLNIYFKFFVRDERKIERWCILHEYKTKRMEFIDSAGASLQLAHLTLLFVHVEKTKRVHVRIRSIMKPKMKKMAIVCLLRFFRLRKPILPTPIYFIATLISFTYTYV